MQYVVEEIELYNDFNLRSFRRCGVDAHHHLDESSIRRDDDGHLLRIDEKIVLLCGFMSSRLNCCSLLFAPGGQHRREGVCGDRGQVLCQRRNAGRESGDQRLSQQEGGSGLNGAVRSSASAYCGSGVLLLAALCGSCPAHNR